jgi:MFS family permease
VPRIAVDITSLRVSRDLRLLVLGNVVSGLGTQAALVALPYQVYVQTGSAFLTGLLGAVELGPLIALALVGGALADRFDRRRLLLVDQLGLVACAGGLAALAFAPGDAPRAALYVLGGLLAGSGSPRSPAESILVHRIGAKCSIRPP